MIDSSHFKVQGRLTVPIYTWWQLVAFVLNTCLIDTQTHMYLNLYIHILERKNAYSTFNSAKSNTFLEVLVYNETHTHTQTPEHLGEDQVLHLLQSISLGSVGNTTDVACNLFWGPLNVGSRDLLPIGQLQEGIWWFFHSRTQALLTLQQQSCDCLIASL